MKLIINYDLINEIIKANTGIDVKRFGLKMGIYMGTITAVDLTALMINPEANSLNLATALLHSSIVFGMQELALKSITTREANTRLNNLASSLAKINVYTDAESIKQARLYKTKLKLVRDDKTTIQQNKYIMLQTSGTLNADEISILQEHNLGSNEYVLSIGEPKKAESKVFQKAYARQI